MAPLFDNPGYNSDVCHVGLGRKDVLTHSPGRVKPQHLILITITRHTLTVGTDCSGLGAPLVALRELGVQFNHVFSCEKDPVAQLCLAANFRPQKMFHDITDWARKRRAGYTDLYISGFPCQPFSTQGRRQGFGDSRSDIFSHIIRHIRHRKPRAFVLENVVGLKSIDQGRCYQFVMAALEGLGSYNIYVETINPETFKIPQHRPRLFFIGVLRSFDKGFCRPVGSRDKGSLEALLLPRLRTPRATDLPWKTTARENVIKCMSLLSAKGLRPRRRCYVINCDSSRGRCHYMKNRSPCLTANRRLGHWLTNRGRYMHLVEMMLLQGFPLWYKVPPKVRSRKFAGMLGNSMCVGVLRPLLREVLRAARLKRRLFCSRGRN